MMFNFKTILRTLLMITLLMALVLSSAYAVENESARYLMEAETLSDNTIGILFVKGGTSNSGTVTGGALYYGVYNPANNNWVEEPVGEEAPIAKEAALALYNNAPHVAYITSDDKIAYTYKNGDAWNEVQIVESNGSTGKLYGVDLAVDSEGKAHLAYIDTKGAADEYYARDDGMYATNTSGSFVKTVKANCTGWFSSPDGERNELYTPIKITINSSNNCWISLKRSYWSKWMGGSDTSYYLEFYSTTNSSRGANGGSKIIDVCSDGTNYYTLISEGGKYIVLNANSDIGSTIKETAIATADMTLNGSDLYYAVINGTSLLFYQNGTFVEDKTATTSILSNHKIMSTVVCNDEQYVIYTGADEEKSLVVSKLSGEDISEYLISTPKYTVTFNSNGGSAVESQIVNEGECATMPTNPTYGCLNFSDWRIDNTTYNFSTPVTEDITLKAYWQFIVTANAFPSEGGEVTTGNNFSWASNPKTGIWGFNEGVGSAFQVRANDGYVFKEWRIGSTEGEIVSTDSYADVHQEPSNGLWIRQLSTYDPEDLVFYAIFEPTYTITLDANNGLDQTAEYGNLKSGDEIQLSSASSVDFDTPEGKQFAGWSDGINIYQAGEWYTVTGNKTLIAQWNTVINTINLTGIVAPKTGEHPVIEGIATTTEGITLTQIQWQNYGASQVIQTSMLYEANKIYALYVLFEVEDGYVLSDTVTVTAEEPYEELDPRFPDYIYILYPSTTKQGDLNSDTNINIIDVKLLLQKVINNSSSSADLPICDLNNDGNVNIIDVKLLLQRVISGS